MSGVSEQVWSVGVRGQPYPPFPLGGWEGRQNALGDQAVGGFIVGIITFSPI
jgi:hypothetical protein